MKSLLINMAFTVAFLVLVVCFGLVLGHWLDAYHEKYDPRYMVTIKSTDTVHRHARIFVNDMGILYVTDAEGREYIYREDWEAVEEQPATVK